MEAPQDTQQFHRLVRRLDYPMFVVTAAASGERSGCLVGFTTQCSIDPPRFWVGISVRNHTHGVARRAAYLGVHLLERSDRELAELFGTLTGDEVDKLAWCAWREGPHGAVLLDGVADWFVGRVVEVLPGGDHTWFMVEPVAVRSAGAGRPMGFQDVRDLEPGHDP
jgi:flavin reductase (DIM6/NTAB) family NADH-FMN oxidoreductase RutF